MRRLVVLVRRVRRRLIKLVGSRKMKTRGTGKGGRMPLRRKARRKPLRRRRTTRRRRRRTQKTGETRGNWTYGPYSMLAHLDILDLPKRNKFKTLVTAPHLK